MSSNNEPLTTQQMKALHLWFRQCSEVLREQGVDIRKALHFPIMPTEEVIKNDIFKPILLAMFGKTSTTQLSKQKEIDDIYDVINKTFSEMGIELPPFPSEENTQEALKSLES